MRAKRYPPEKRTLLAAKPTQLLEFLYEVPPKLIKPIAMELPVVAGFRPGQLPDIKRRLELFIARIRRWSDPDWERFQKIWLSWIKAHSELDIVLTQYDNMQDFSGKEVVAPNSTLDIGCFRHLVQASQLGKVSREVIRRFYEFGYFLADPSIEQAISSAMSESELKVLKDFEALHHQVNQLSAMLQAVDEALHEDQAKTASLTERVGKAEQWVNLAQQSTRAAQVETEALDQQLADVDRKVGHVQLELDRRDALVRLELAEQKASVKALAQELKSAVADVEARMRELSDLLAAAQAESSAAKEGAGSISDDRDASKVRGPTSRSEAPGSRVEPAPLLVQQIPPGPPDQVLGDPELTIKMLSDNLKAIGMNSRAAHALATEVLAGLLAGQALMFKGSMASATAEICAHTLAAASTYHMQMPLGLLDGRQFSAAFDEVVRESRQSDQTTGLVIEGLNLSAPEVYAQRLRKLVTDRLLGLDDEVGNLLVVGTIAHGSACLSIASELCELGPIFDTDCLTWRSKWGKRGITRGSILRGTWSHWVDTLVQEPTDWADVLRECHGLAGSVPPLWKRTLYTALARLTPLAVGDDQPTAMQSLAFGWLLPRLVAAGVDLSEKDSVLGGGMLDASAVDTRITRLLGDWSKGEHA